MVFYLIYMYPNFSAHKYNLFGTQLQLLSHCNSKMSVKKDWPCGLQSLRHLPFVPLLKWFANPIPDLEETLGIRFVNFASKATLKMIIQSSFSFRKDSFPGNIVHVIAQLDFSVDFELIYSTMKSNFIL